MRATCSVPTGTQPQLRTHTTRSCTVCMWHLAISVEVCCEVWCSPPQPVARPAAWAATCPGPAGPPSPQPALHAHRRHRWWHPLSGHSGWQLQRCHASTPLALAHNDSRRAIGVFIQLQKVCVCVRTGTTAARHTRAQESSNHWQPTGNPPPAAAVSCWQCLQHCQQPRAAQLKPPHRGTSQLPHTPAHRSPWPGAAWPASHMPCRATLICATCVARRAAPRRIAVVTCSAPFL